MRPSVACTRLAIRPVHLTSPDAAAMKVMVGDLSSLQKEITRRRNQLQQITAATFPELKTFFRDSTASPTARALLASFPTPQDLVDAATLAAKLDHQANRRAGGSTP